MWAEPKLPPYQVNSADGGYQRHQEQQPRNSQCSPSDQIDIHSRAAVPSLPQCVSEKENMGCDYGFDQSERMGDRELV